MSLYDFTRSGICHGATIRPAAGRTVYPIYYIISDIHRIYIGREHINLKSIDKSSGFKSLIPPTSAFEQGRTDWFRRTTIQIIYNRFNCFTFFSTRIFLYQSVPVNKPFHDWRGNRRGIIHIICGEITGTWIRNPRFKIIIRQLDK